ncbi:methyl-accepting chemotaxis protein [Rheinheimera sp.]|uniref:methyl-accepting chemotaxis protein n=1 Tax=Rheinheimera sp. TaxID=1869214 RepID=UPI00307D422D
MGSWIRQLALTQKLLLLLVLPLAGMVLFSGFYLLQKYQTLAEMQQIRQVSLKTGLVSLLINELQKERGLSGLFLSSKGANQLELARFRASSDAALQQLRQHANEEDPLLRQALVALQELEAVRQQVDRFSLQPPQSAAAYTRQIVLLTGFTQQMEGQVSDPELLTAFIQLNQLIEMKERAGRERALLAVIFHQNGSTPESLQRFLLNLGEYQTYLARLTQKLSAAQQQQLQQLLTQPIMAEVEQLKQLVQTTAPGLPLHISGADWFTKSTARIELLHQFEKQLNQGIADAAAAKESAAGRAFWLALVSVALVLALACYLALLIISNIRLAAASVTRALQELSERDLTAVSGYQGQDEFGDIAKALNRTSAELKQVMLLISDATVQLASASEQASIVTAQISKGISQQQQDTETVVTAMHEMGATVRDVARSTGEAAELSRQANSEAVQGQHDIDGTVRLIQSLEAQVHQTAQTLAELKAGSETITSVLDVIRGIADQTNLLALNAAIEAARAGDQGRGFAVVASEVRTLAQRTQESTLSIQDMIERLRRGADQANSAMDQCMEQARVGVNQVVAAGQLLHQIAGGISHINDMNTQIASAAEQQHVVVDDINKNLQRINEVAHQTSTGAEETAATSQQLAQLAEQLQQQVGRFKL